MSIFPFHYCVQDSLHLAAAEKLFLATDAGGETGKSGDTLNEVIKDTARRNKLVGVIFLLHSAKIKPGNPMLLLD